MSTMLRYAAMTLLSKTLQTFLSKYLVDIDVEGIAMPSLMDTEGGWGVKLSNVRLREGVELMALPGKRKTTKKSPRKTQRTHAAESMNGTSKTAIGGERELFQNGDAQTKPMTETDERESADQAEVGTVGSAASSDYFTSEPPSPPGSTKGTWGCFKTENPCVTASESNDTENGIQTPGFASPARKSSYAEDFQADPNIPMRVAKKLNFETTTHKSNESETEPTKTNEINSEEDKEDEVVVEQDMVLRLAGGRIGALNVRLVGKELSVLVEDAFLVVEAVPRNDVTEASPKDVAIDSNETSKRGDSTDKGPETPRTGKKIKELNEPQTEGDRVMQSSAIARALSSIPRLLLRDCRVRLVVRGEKRKEASNDKSSDVGNDDSIVEIGVELLSVTGGEDFLAFFTNVEEEPTTSSAAVGGGQASTYGFQSESSAADTTLPSGVSDSNDYLTRRIRTGKGPEGGIWVKIFPPGRSQRQDLTYMFEPKSSSSDEVPMWALHRWYASQQMFFFRCSGLDLCARIFLGKKVPENEQELTHYFFGDEYDEYTIDSMLFGADYVVPGPPRELPSLPEEFTLRDPSILDPENAGILEDNNGIQRYEVPSIFFRIGQGLKPVPPQGDHPPCYNSLSHWETGEEQLIEHRLDQTCPMPGVVVHLSLSDPLELNIDRAGLLVLGVVRSLFTNKSATSDVDESADATEQNGTEEVVNGNAVRSKAKARDLAADVDKDGESFPLFMQPEAIQLAGVHVARLCVRVHVMSRDGQYDCGLSFCYWDLLAECLTLDHQKLTTKERGCQDLRFDVGELALTEYRGTQQQKLISLGLPLSEESDNDTNKSDSGTSSDKRSLWPTTASVLLNLSVPLETASYESRERHGIQMRYISVSDPGEDIEDVQSMVHVRVGTGAIDKLWESKTDISSILAESKNCLASGAEQSVGRPPKPTDRNEKEQRHPPTNSLMKYRVVLDGGKLNPYPSVRFRVPMSTFTGELSSDTGFFITSLLSKVELQYGKQRQQQQAPETVFLSRFASLPEGVRMRILLFLPDLTPLETALSIKTEANSFLGCRAVNKKLVKLAKKRRHTKKQRKTKAPKPERRQELLSSIMKLDDASLEELWHLHLRIKRRAKRNLSSSSI